MAAHSPVYLDAALRSVLAQSYTRIEVIVIDDSTDDAVRNIVQAARDPRVRYFHNPEKLGSALSHRRAIELASGEFLAVINDDDLWEPTFVETLLDALLGFPEAVLAFADHWVLVGDSRDSGESDQVSAIWGRAALEAGPYQPFRRLAVIDRAISIAIASLFRRNAVVDRGIPAEVGGAYDLYLAYVLSRTGGAAVYVDRRLSSWRIHSANQTGVRSCARAEENAAVMRLIAEDRAFVDLQPELSRQYGASLWTVATRNIRYGSDRRAFQAIQLALRHRNGRAALLLGPLLLPRPVRRHLW